MFTNFNEAERAIRFPPDRRMFIGINPYVLVIIAVFLFLTVGLAWLQYLVFGLPPDPSILMPVTTAADPKGFPLWLCLSHWVNFFFLALIIRSGLSILADHPRLYWDRGCSPRSEWIRFTPVKVPDDRVYTAKEDSRYLNPVAGLPGYRHSVGIARSWHFITVPFFLLNGAVCIFFLFFTNQWKRLIPASCPPFSGPCSRLTIESRGLVSRRNIRRPFWVFAAASSSGSAWRIRARTSSPCSSAPSCRRTAVPGSSTSRYWARPSENSTASK